MKDQILKVREIFYSLQGEGGRAGEASIFIRLSNCNLNCWFCDTDWSTGDERTMTSILEEIMQYPGKWIVWTGGEPTMQLTSEMVMFFKNAGYMQAIETNGTNKVPEGIDYIVCSPKVDQVDLEVVRENFKFQVIEEIRMPCDKIHPPPSTKLLPKANRYYISPIFLGELKKRFQLVDHNLQFCIEFAKLNPEWRVSVQQHKLWNIR